MKILQINAVGQTASTGRTCKELQEYINKNTEHSCYTAFPIGTKNEYSYQIGSKTDRKIHAFLSRLTGKQAHFSVSPTRDLLKYIDELRPDIVHLRNLHGNYINVPILLKYLAEHDIATVITLHDCWFYTGKCCYYTVDDCYRWQTGCHDCPRLRKDNESWLVDATSQLWREKKNLFESIPRLAVVGVSDWITGEARQSFLSCAKYIQRIYNWIDLDIFKPMDSGEEIRKKYDLGDNKIVLGVSSKWTDAKGLSSFIKLSQMLPENYRIVLVGNADDSIQFTDKITHISGTDLTVELAAIYSAADVFVTFSLEETFGKVSAEAISCGTPVVCYDSTANKELIADGCGAVVQVRDIDGMSQAVKEICFLGKEQYRGKCRAFAIKMFNMETDM